MATCFFLFKIMISVFKDAFETQTPYNCHVSTVIDWIRTGKYRQEVEAVRSEADKEKRNDLKVKLRSICFSGTFSQRSKINLIEPSGLACFDFDDCDISYLEKLKDNPYIYIAFISPSGNGIKAIVKIPKKASDYTAYYEAIADTFSIKCDAKTKDISRLCFVSYDPYIYVNEESKIWEIKKEYEERLKSEFIPKYLCVSNLDEKVKIILNWFNKRYTLIEGQRNSNLFILSASLNRVGLDYYSALSLLQSEYHANLEDKEIENIVKSAYKNVTEHNTVNFVDKKKEEKAKLIIEKGERVAKRSLAIEGYSEDDYLDLLDYDFIADDLIFWEVNKDSKIILNDYKFKLFLQNRGFYKLQLNDTEFTFVRIDSNVISEVSEVGIKDFIMSYISEHGENVYNFFARKTSVFTEQYLSLLDTVQLNLLRDNSTTSYFFFKNKIVKIQRKSIELIDYIDAHGLVWKKQIIQKDFTETTDRSDFERFIFNLSKQEKKRKEILESALGYLLHRFKKQDEGIAVVLYDETLNENPSGRTGKTVISKAISEVRKLVTLNGKEFNNKGQFPYQTVSLDDNVICFDDLTSNFKFEELFSTITGDIVLNKKNLQPITIPYNSAPKILFTSNYILKGEGDSHDDRKVEIELYRHYSKSYKPIDDFGKPFFSENWSDIDWSAFYGYMIYCVRLYFAKGIIRPTLESSRTRKLISETNEDFFEFCENREWVSQEFFKTKEVLEWYRMTDYELPDRMNTKWFGRWLASYFAYKGWRQVDRTYNGIRSWSLEVIN